MNMPAPRPVVTYNSTETLSADRLLGKKCVICGEKSKGKVPVIGIGRYTEFKTL